MPSGLDVFDTTLQKTNELLSSIENQFGWAGRRNQSYQALRTVLHALRDRLPIDDAVNFSAQLPLLVKGVFFDGWNPSIVPVKMDREEFLNCIGQNFKFDIEGGLEELVRVVLSEVFAIIDPSEAEKITNALPKDLKNFLCG